MSVLKMPVAIEVLCYEHHIRMSPKKAELRHWGPFTDVFAYACPEPGCPIHYNRSLGYFLVQFGVGLNKEMVPTVKCPQDRLPMYLAEVRRDRQDFRLWRCHRCSACRTNESRFPPVANRLGI